MTSELVKITESNNNVRSNLSVGHRLVYQFNLQWCGAVDWQHGVYVHSGSKGPPMILHSGFV